MEPSYIETNRFEQNGEEHYYVLPWTKLITGIAYNSELFERYDIEVPKTMEEFDEVCETIIEKSTAEGKRIAPFVASGRTLGYFDFMCMNLWIQRSGLDAVKEFFAFGDVEVFNPAKEPYKGYVSAWKDFAKYFGPDGFSKYCLSGSMSKEVYDAQRDLINGEAAMMINADWLEREMINLVDETGFKMKLMQFPVVSDAKRMKTGIIFRSITGRMQTSYLYRKKRQIPKAQKNFSSSCIKKIRFKLLRKLRVLSVRLNTTLNLCALNFRRFRIPYSI